ncbi:MAG: TIGR02452 family protein [Rubripirellula sp.]
MNGTEVVDHSVALFYVAGFRFLGRPTGRIVDHSPCCPAIGRWGAEPMLRQRIHRFLDVVQADEYDSVSLGVWGCGVFANDPLQTAKDFRDSHEGEFAAAFQRTVFGIADWPTQQSYFRQFCDVFSER